jgi:hypothetical protein
MIGKWTSLLISQNLTRVNSTFLAYFKFGSMRKYHIINAKKEFKHIDERVASLLIVSQ